MLDLKDELNKYKPIVGLDDVEGIVQNNEIHDMMELLQYLAKQISTAKE